MTESSSCPQRSQLEGYVQGAIAEDRAANIAAHLESCPECERLVEQLEQRDEWSARFFSQTNQNLFIEEPECRQIVAQLANWRGSAAVREKEAPLRRIRDYQLLERIGEGGMGAVYRALHTRLEKIVAVKLLSSRRVPTASTLERFQREMRAVGKLNHPNIVQATDAGQEDGRPYLVMEFVAGCDLARLVQRLGPIPMAEASEIIRQAALALQHAHERGLIHRDVKPSNLMLSDDGEVKLLDLGLALLFEDDESIEPATPAPSTISESRGRTTASGQLLGTIDYMAPEQHDDSRKVDQRADIYSLGRTYADLLTGNQRDRDVPAPLRSILRHMLATDPDNRTTSAVEVAQAIQPFCRRAALKQLLHKPADSHPVTLAVQQRSWWQRSWRQRSWRQRSWRQRSWRQRSWWLGIAALIGILAVPAIGFWTMHVGGERQIVQPSVQPSISPQAPDAKPLAFRLLITDYQNRPRAIASVNRDLLLHVLVEGHPGSPRDLFMSQLDVAFDAQLASLWTNQAKMGPDTLATAQSLDVADVDRFEPGSAAFRVSSMFPTENLAVVGDVNLDGFTSPLDAMLKFRDGAFRNGWQSPESPAISVAPAMRQTLVTLPFRTTPEGELEIVSSASARQRFVETTKGESPPWKVTYDRTFLKIVAEAAGNVVNEEVADPLSFLPRFAAEPESTAKPRLEDRDPADVWVRFTLVVADDEGYPVDFACPGEQLTLHCFCQDVRSKASGVFAAYLNVDYDQNFASLGDVRYSPRFSNAQKTEFAQDGKVRVGAFRTVSLRGNEYGPLAEPSKRQAVFQCTVEVAREAAGKLTFASSAEEEPTREVLVHDEPFRVPMARIEYGHVQLAVVSPQEAEQRKRESPRGERLPVVVDR